MALVSHVACILALLVLRLMSVLPVLVLIGEGDRFDWGIGVMLLPLVGRCVSHWSV